MASPTAEVLQRARALQGEGDLMSLSHIGPVNKFGVRQSEAAQERMDAAEIPESLQNIGQGVLYNPNDQTSFVPQEYQDQITGNRQHSLDIANIQNSFKGQPSASQENKLAEWDAQITTGQGLLNSLGGTDAIDPVTDVAIQAGRSIGGNTVANLMDGWLRTPEGQSTRAGFLRYMARLRKSELGAALTGYEIDSAEQWSPVAAGITKAESRRRMQAIMQDVGLQRDALAKYTCPDQQPTNQQPTMNQQPVPTETKSLGGKNYIKMDGQWYEDI